MGVAKWKATSDFRELERDFAKLQKENAKLIQSNQKLADQSKKAQTAAQNAMRQQGAMAKNQASAVRKVTAGVMDMASSYLSVNAAIQLVVKSIKEKQEAERRANLATIGAAASEAEVRTNLGRVSSGEFRGFLKDLKDISKAASFGKVEQVNLAAASILSATGGSQEQTKAILQAITPLFRTKPDQLAQFGGALGDVKTAGGFKSAKEAAAFMVALQGQGRFTELGAFKNVAPVMSAAAATSPDDRRVATAQAGAFVAGIGRTIGDPDASLTKGAAANLLIRMKKVIEENVDELEASSLKTPMQRLQFLRSRPDLQAEVTKSGFRGANIPVIEQLLAGTGDVTAAVDGALKKMNASLDDFNRLSRDLAGGTLSLSLDKLRRGREGVKEEKERGQDRRAVMKEMREQLELARTSRFPGTFVDSLIMGARDPLKVRSTVSRVEDAKIEGATDLADFTRKRVLSHIESVIEDRRLMVNRSRRVRGGVQLGPDDAVPLVKSEQRIIGELVSILENIRQFMRERAQRDDNSEAKLEKLNQTFEKVDARIGKSLAAQQNVNKGNAAAARGNHLEN